MNDTTVIFLCMIAVVLVITFCFGLSIALQALMVLLVSTSFAMGWLMGYENGTAAGFREMLTEESEG